MDNVDVQSSEKIPGKFVEMQFDGSITSMIHICTDQSKVHARIIGDDDTLMYSILQVMKKDNRIAELMGAASNAYFNKEIKQGEIYCVEFYDGFSDGATTVLHHRCDHKPTEKEVAKLLKENNVDYDPACHNYFCYSLGDL